MPPGLQAVDIIGHPKEQRGKTWYLADVRALCKEKKIQLRLHFAESLPGNVGGPEGKHCIAICECDVFADRARFLFRRWFCPCEDSSICWD